MSKATWGALSAVVMALLPVSVSAGSYVSNRTTWREMSAEQRQGYAMGAFDSLGLLNNDPAQDASAMGRSKCAKELRLSADDLVKLISDQYERDPTVWGLPAFAVLNNELNKTCGAFIDTERRAVGLPPLRK